MRNNPLLSKRKISNGPAVLFPDESDMKTTRLGTRNMPLISTKARIARALLTITKSLLSMSAMHHEGDEAKFMKKEVHVTFKGVIILKEKR